MSGSYYIQDGDVIEDLVLVVQGGKVVARVRARLDLSEVPEEYLGFVIIQRTKLAIPSWEELERMQVRDEAYRRRLEEYERLKTEYGVLPWWKKLFTRRPSIYRTLDVPG